MCILYHNTLMCLHNRNKSSMLQVSFKIMYEGMRGTWVAQLVKHLTSAQAMISWFLSLSLALGSLLSAQSLLQIPSLPLSPSLSLSLPLLCSYVRSLFLSQKLT